MKIFFCLLTVGLSITSQTCCAQARDISLATLKSSKVSNATATITQFRGSAAFTLVPTKEMNPGANNQGPLAILNEVQFRNGSIDVDVAGAPAEGLMIRHEDLSELRFAFNRRTASRLFTCARPTPMQMTNCGA